MYIHGTFIWVHCVYIPVASVPSITNKSCAYEFINKIFLNGGRKDPKRDDKGKKNIVHPYKDEKASAFVRKKLNSLNIIIETNIKPLFKSKKILLQLTSPVPKPCTSRS